LWRKWRLYFDIRHILYLKFAISKWNRKCGALPVVVNFVAWEEADYYVENCKLVGV